MQIPSLDYLDLTAQIQIGSPAIFPTDTLPALGVLPKFANKLWELKQRPLNKPLILMGFSKEQLFEFVLPSALDDAQGMAEKYWPGALTMVLPAIGSEVSFLNQNSESLGIRVPANTEAIKLLSKTGPLATTSANISGEEPLLTAQEAFANFPDIPLLGPLPWKKSSYKPSTVISWISSGKWKILRKGSLIPQEIKK